VTEIQSGIASRETIKFLTLR